MQVIASRRSASRRNFTVAEASRWVRGALPLGGVGPLTRPRQPAPVRPTTSNQLSMRMPIRFLWVRARLNSVVDGRHRPDSDRVPVMLPFAPHSFLAPGDTDCLKHGRPPCLVATVPFIRGVYDALIEMPQRDSPARARQAAFDIVGPSRSSSSHGPLGSGSRLPSCGSSPHRAMPRDGAFTLPDVRSPTPMRPRHGDAH